MACSLIVVFLCVALSFFTTGLAFSVVFLVLWLYTWTSVLVCAKICGWCNSRSVMQTSSENSHRFVRFICQIWDSPHFFMFCVCTLFINIRTCSTVFFILFRGRKLNTMIWYLLFCDVHVYQCSKTKRCHYLIVAPKQKPSFSKTVILGGDI